MEAIGEFIPDRATGARARRCPPGFAAWRPFPALQVMRWASAWPQRWRCCALRARLRRGRCTIWTCSRLRTSPAGSRTCPARSNTASSSPPPRWTARGERRPRGRRRPPGGAGHGGLQPAAGSRAGNRNPTAGRCGAGGWTDAGAHDDLAGRCRDWPAAALVRWRMTGTGTRRSSCGRGCGSAPPRPGAGSAWPTRCCPGRDSPAGPSRPCTAGARSRRRGRRGRLPRRDRHHARPGPGPAQLPPGGRGGDGARPDPHRGRERRRLPGPDQPAAGPRRWTRTAPNPPRNCSASSRAPSSANPGTACSTWKSSPPRTSSNT